MADSAGSGATEEGLTSRGGRHLRLPLRFGLRPQGPCRVGTGEGERVLALESREGTRASRRVEEGLSRSFSAFTSFILTVSNSLRGSKLFEYLKLPVPLEAGRLSRDPL